MPHPILIPLDRSVTVLNITKDKIFNFLYCGDCVQIDNYAEYLNEVDQGDPKLTEGEFNALKICDLKNVFVGPSRSFWLSGDDIAGIVQDTLVAMKDGYTVETWCGLAGEVMVFGYKPNQLIPVEPLVNVG